jgi:hypothetical protein
MANRSAQEDPAEDCPQTAGRSKGNQDVAGDLEVLLYEHREVLEENRYLYTKQSCVVIQMDTQNQ